MFPNSMTKKREKMSKLIPVLMLTITQLGCATKIHYYKAYEGTNIHPNQLSKLHVPEDIKINTIDGKGGFYPRYVSDISPYSGAIIELIPGTHTLNAEYYYKDVARQSGSTNLKLTTSPGKAYFIYEEHKYIDSKAHAHFDFYECGSQKEKEVNLARKNLTEKSLLFTYPPLCGE